MSYLVWVGPRDTDWKYDSSFSEAICYYSSKNYMEERKAHIYGKTFNSFVETEMKRIIKNHPDVEFIFYNQKIAHLIDISLKKYAICVNERNLLDIMENKIYMRYWAGNYVPVLPSLLVDSKSLCIKELHEKLDKRNEFVVQQNNNSGGFGTFYLTGENNMLPILKENYSEIFIVSPYIANNIPINVNAVIFNDKIIMFPPSLQIVTLDENRLLYRGADFISIQHLPAMVMAKIYEYTEIILKRIQKMGYLGILGIDFIVVDNNVYFQEINPRYQASSFLINAALNEYGLSNLSEINIAAFTHHPVPLEEKCQIKINYSFYKEIYRHGNKHLYHLWNVAPDNVFIKDIFADGWNPEMEVEDDAYCYTLVFSTNITSINLDGNFDLYPNISGEEVFIQKYSNTYIGLKISLLNQGCVLTQIAKQFLQTSGLIKQAVFSAIDFYLDTGTPLNVPIDLKFTDFSPYTIDINNQNIPCLYYYGQLLSEITIEMQPDWNDRLTQNGIPYRKIAYLSTDRLRIKHESLCVFKSKECGCYFCNVPQATSNHLFMPEDFSEVIHQLFIERKFRHILIGGASAPEEEEIRQILFITRLIRAEDAFIPIYLMCLPPSNRDMLKQYKDAGITEVAFNIEIWDRQLAERLMPGKGKISLATYMDALTESTKLWGKMGNVRTALIVGLNRTESLLEATEILCRHGIQPMLSVFRPMENTKLYQIVPPSNEKLLDIYRHAQTICKKYGLELGPSCDACKNNMLA